VSDQKHEVIAQAMQSTPSITAATATVLLGVTVSEWLGIVSIGFIVLQAAYLVWKWRREARKK